MTTTQDSTSAAVKIAYFEATKKIHVIPITLKIQNVGRSMLWKKLNEPPHDKTNNVACAPSEDSDQPGHPPSLIRVFAVRSMGS